MRSLFASFLVQIMHRIICRVSIVQLCMSGNDTACLSACQSVSTVLQNQFFMVGSVGY